MAPYIFVFTWIIAELELILFSLKDSSLFGIENEFVFKSSLCERSRGHEENLEPVPNCEYHEGRFLPKPLTLGVSDIFQQGKTLSLAKFHGEDIFHWHEFS